MTSGLLLPLESFADPLSWSLLHSLWQGGLIAGCLWMTHRLIPSRRAEIRYAASCGALLLILILSVTTFCNLTLTAAPLSSSETSPPRMTFIDGQTLRSPNEVASSTFLSWTRLEDLPLTSWVFLSWLGGVALLSVYHLIGWSATRRLVRKGVSRADSSWQIRLDRLCLRLGLHRTIPLAESVILRVPCVVGWIRPVVLVPTSALAGLSVEQLEMILAHELAHIRRHDVFVNYIQTVVETLLFHNPAVWWISRQVRVEREHCCDDVAANICGNRLLYARALADMEDLRKSDPSFSMAVDGASLIDRIRRLAGQGRATAYKPGVGIMNLIALITLIGFGILTVDCHTTRTASAALILPEALQHTPSPEAIEGQWTIEPHHERIQLMMRRDSHGRMGFTIHPDELEDFSLGKNQSFRLARDAGTFFFQGDVQRDSDSYSGSGKWYFEPNASYIKVLEGLGFEITSDERTMELAIHDVTLDYVHGLDREGYRGFSISKLVELRIHNVTPEYIHELAELGYKDLSLAKLVEMQIHDVEPEYIRAMKDLGYHDLSASKLVEMQIHDVTPEYVGELSKLGYKDLTASKLVEMQIHDVEPGYIRALAELGYKELSASKLVEMQIHDVDLEYIRGLSELGYEDLSASRLVEMRIQNVELEYIRELADLGYRDLTPSKLVEMRIHDVRPSYVRELAEVGMKDLTASRLVEMRIHHVDADFVRKLQDRGYQDLTPGRVIELKIHGIH